MMFYYMNKRHIRLCCFHSVHLANESSVTERADLHGASRPIFISVMRYSLLGMLRDIILVLVSLARTARVPHLAAGPPAPLTGHHSRTRAFATLTKHNKLYKDTRAHVPTDYYRMMSRNNLTFPGVAIVSGGKSKYKKSACYRDRYCEPNNRCALGPSAPPSAPSVLIARALIIYAFRDTCHWYSELSRTEVDILSLDTKRTSWTLRKLQKLSLAADTGSWHAIWIWNVEKHYLSFLWMATLLSKQQVLYCTWFGFVYF